MAATHYYQKCKVCLTVMLGIFRAGRGVPNHSGRPCPVREVCYECVEAEKMLHGQG